MSPSATVDQPVVVIGGGPAGLAAAVELAHRDVPVTLVEPRVTVSHDRPRAKTISARTMEHMRRWGLATRLRERAPLAPDWSDRVVFCATLDAPEAAEFTGVFGLLAARDNLAAEGGQQVPQPIVEELLREHLLELENVDMRLGSRALALRDRGDWVEVQLAGPNGPELVLGSHVLGCDGPRSVVRTAIGATYQGSSDTRSNLNVVFRSADLRPAAGKALQYWMLSARPPAVGGPLDLEGRWWMGFLGVEAARAGEAAELVRSAMGTSNASTDLEVLATDPWTPRMMVADRFSRGRVHLVGESAHLNPPFGGHGFNTCIGDAVNIAWKVAAVRHGWGGPGLLASYEAERRVSIEQTIESAVSNLQANTMQAHTDPGTIFQSKREEFHSLGLVLGYEYPTSPVVQPGTSPRPMNVAYYEPRLAPGARLPHCWLADGTSLFDRLGPDFTLLCPVDGEGAASAWASEARRQGVPMSVLPTPADHVAADVFVLVRPDQHVAWVAMAPSEIDLALVRGA